MTTDSINNSVVSKFDLGMTFCEVNERAYVRTVDPESEAALAGVRPRDCVQLALVLAGGKLEALQEDDRRAVSHALECESGGSRTSYDEMRVLFERCSLTPRSSSTGSTDKVSDSIFENSSVSSEEGRKTGYFSSNVTKTTQRILSRYTPTQAHEQMDGGWMPSSLDDEALYPVVLVFRRTRKRIPGLSPINVPTFRLDDECERAANLIRRLAPTVDTEFQPDAWDEIMDNAKGYFKAMTDTSGDVSNKNIKDSRSLSKVPGYSSLTIAPNEAQKFEDEIIPLDPIEEKTVQLMESLKNKMKADLDNRRNDGGDNDVEAETIRGMVQQALGLAFIRTSKVVLGVSVHAGTGIVIARLPDGTWSAPSAIGAYGLGLGIQFGVETVDYIFVIQKQEALEHFLRGGNFTLGGNVGAALAGLGREAYGAASFRDTICLSPADRLEVENPIVENATDVAPIVAYAKAQGLYVGMSVEGQKFFTRDDVNDRIYKFMAGRSVTAREILTGVISTPPEAEDLYAALHR
jgi:lipid-binding SYLF domain-containing protein